MLWVPADYYDAERKVLGVLYLYSEADAHSSPRTSSTPLLELGSCLLALSASLLLRGIQLAFNTITTVLTRVVHKPLVQELPKPR